MHAFTDANGKQWDISIDVATLRDVRDRLGVDLLNIGDGGSLARLSEDVCALVDVLYILCKEQADNDGVSDRDFGRACKGDVLDDATNAFIMELVDFFPKAKRDAFKVLLRKINVSMERQNKKLMMIAESIDMEKVMSGQSSTNMPESVE